jgi:hypothetical protein
LRPVVPWLPDLSDHANQVGLADDCRRLSLLTADEDVMASRYWARAPAEGQDARVILLSIDARAAGH